MKKLFYLLPLVFVACVATPKEEDYIVTDSTKVEEPVKDTTAVVNPDTLAPDTAK